MHSDFSNYFTCLAYLDDADMGNLASTETMQTPTHQHIPKVRLDNIPEDVQYLIASELSKTSPSAVLALAQSSSALRRAALPFVYRKLVLKKGFRKRDEDAYQALLYMFTRDRKCDVVKNVRSIVVQDELLEGDLLLILSKIAECGSLHKMR